MGILLNTGKKGFLTNFGTMVMTLAPITYGTAATLVAGPKRGKTTGLKDITKNALNNKAVDKVFYLVLDERKEEAQELREWAKADSRINVIELNCPTLDTKALRAAIQADDSKAIKEVFRKNSLATYCAALEAVEIAREAAEEARKNNEDILLLVDSITRMSRMASSYVGGYLKEAAMSGGQYPAIMSLLSDLYNTRFDNGKGSLTIIAAVLNVFSADDYLAKEACSKGLVDITLSKELVNKGIFPAICLDRDETSSRCKIENYDVNGVRERYAEKYRSLGWF